MPGIHIHFVGQPWTQQAKNTEEIHKAAGMINNQYSQHRDDTETSTENKAVIKKTKEELL